jgi:nucleoside 2-deoxyribosyltransferase
MNRVYLAGPITGCSYNECTDWRQSIRDAVGPHIQTFSPMRGKERLKEKEAGSVIKDHYTDSALTTVKGINTRDHNDVKRADALFVNLLGAKRVSIGTVMEIAWARAYSKPIICIMEEDNIHHHSMLNYSCGYIVDTLAEGVEILNVLLSSDQELEYQAISFDKVIH